VPAEGRLDENFIVFENEGNLYHLIICSSIGIDTVATTILYAAGLSRQ
jgi:hypothetical protein